MSTDPSVGAGTSQESNTPLYDLIVFDFKGTLQKKLKKDKTNLEEKKKRKEEKLRRRASRFYQVVQQKLPTCPLPEFDKFFEVFLEFKVKYDNKTDECYSWSEVLDDLVLYFQLPVLSEYYEEFFDEVPPPLYSGARDILEFIRNLNIPMVMIRNSNLSMVSMENTLRQLDILDYFIYIVTSGEVGYRKPDAQIFEYCLKKANISTDNLKAERILMIGNEADTDILGAKNLGWSTVLICHTEESSHGLADYDIHELRELENIILPSPSSK